jgi:hypothetical protein
MEDFRKAKPQSRKTGCRLEEIASTRRAREGQGKNSEAGGIGLIISSGTRKLYGDKRDLLAQ